MAAEQATPVRNILAVEDEPDHLMAVEMIFLGVPEYRFFGAGNTAEAEEILAREKIDLILLDLMLPGEDGLTFCRRIKQDERYRALPVIAFSAYPRGIYEERALEAGCADFVEKPFHPRDLIALVGRHLAAG